MRILLVEDNHIIRENIHEYLKYEWHQVQSATNGSDAYEIILRDVFDFFIIDRMLPGIDGLSLMRMIQSKWVHTPFLFLTALDKQIDKIEWLSIGADDYLVKPFHLEELHLRIQNIVRRKLPENHQASSPHIYQIGEITINTKNGKIEGGNGDIELSPKEYQIIKHLLQHRGTIVSKQQIYESVWGDYSHYQEDLDTINVHIAHIRKKLGSEIIRTQKLEGYVID